MGIPLQVLGVIACDKREAFVQGSEAIHLPLLPDGLLR
jgi:hypothetical protein